MASSDDLNIFKARLDEAFSKLDKMDSRMTSLENWVSRAVRNLMPKVEELLARVHKPVANVSCAALCPLSSASFLELADRGDGEAILKIVSESQNNGKDLNMKTVYGDTALHIAARMGHKKVVMVLLGTGMNVNIPGHRLRTPLHYAVAYSHQQIVQCLLNARALINVLDEEGAPPLKLATDKGDLEMIKLLLQKGAHSFEYVLYWAIGHHPRDFVEFMLAFILNETSLDDFNEQGDTLLVQAVRAGHLSVIELLLQKGASAIVCRDPQESALVLAAKNNSADMVRELLCHGAANCAAQIDLALGITHNIAVVQALWDVDPNYVYTHAGPKCLRSACCCGHYNNLILLLHIGICINSKDNNGRTGVWYAAAHGKILCLRELLIRGAKMNLRDKNGDTALHAASAYGHMECVRALVEAGADCTVKNNDNKTPCEMATTYFLCQVFDSLRLECHRIM